jgi:hypothetical protein
MIARVWRGVIRAEHVEEYIRPLMYGLGEL